MTPSKAHATLVKQLSCYPAGTTSNGKFNVNAVRDVVASDTYHKMFSTAALALLGHMQRKNSFDFDTNLDIQSLSDSIMTADGSDVAGLADRINDLHKLISKYTN